MMHGRKNIKLQRTVYFEAAVNILTYIYRYFKSST